jgi:hypothetical protein
MTGKNFTTHIELSASISNDTLSNKQKLTAIISAFDPDTPLRLEMPSGVEVAATISQAEDMIANLVKNFAKGIAVNNVFLEVTSATVKKDGDAQSIGHATVSARFPTQAIKFSVALPGATSALDIVNGAATKRVREIAMQFLAE